MTSNNISKEWWESRKVTQYRWSFEMAKYTHCPYCKIKPTDIDWTGGYIYLHKCNNGGHLFCSSCKNGDRCPICSSADIWWDYEKAYC